MTDPRVMPTQSERGCTGCVERDRYRAAIREAMDTMAPCTDAELGEGGMARKAYAALYHAYFSIPADTYRAAEDPDV